MTGKAYKTQSDISAQTQKQFVCSSPPQIMFSCKSKKKSLKTFPLTCEAACCGAGRAVRAANVVHVLVHRVHGDQLEHVVGVKQHLIT